MRKWLIRGASVCGVVLASLSVYVLILSDARQKQESAYLASRSAEEREAKAVADVLRSLFDEENDVAAEALASAEAAVLPEATRVRLEDIAAARAVERRFFEQERLLASAGALLAANKDDPIAAEYLSRAKVLSDQNLDALPTLALISGDCVWNTRLQYLSGAVYYRSLVFVTEEEQFRAFDLIEQAIKSFEKVFLCTPKDRAAEVAIELLYEQQNNRSENPNINPGEQISEKELHLKLLPKKQVGIGGENREYGRY